jgi:hypothetical protein
VTVSRALLTDALPLTGRLFEHDSLAHQMALTPLIIYAVFYFSLAAAFLALWGAARDYRVFRSMGIYLLLAGIQVLWIYFGGEKSAWGLAALTAPVLVVIAGEAMRVPNRRWALLIWPFCLLVLCLGWVHSLRFVQPLSIDVSSIFLCILIVQGIRHGQRRDRQIAAAFLFLLCLRWTISPYFRFVTHTPLDVQIGGWHWGVAPAAMIPLGVATLVIFVRDLMNDRREKQRMAAEMAAGRAVQQVLIPEQTQAVPGFRIQSVYKPAGEVGGDFFQILPVDQGGVLVAIGDVSGKGMQAALMVSLLVGSLQTLAESTTSPAEILIGLNRRLLGRSHGGFTTCLVLRCDADGTLTTANAGHIPPYLAGTELPLENGLPLGLAAEVTYAESIFQLLPGEQLTLLTDGVVEARDKSGLLFGFERTAALSAQSAETIAQTAENFGQDDDITALTIALLSL